MTSSDSRFLDLTEQLSTQRIIGLPDSIYYIPEFLNDQELALVESKLPNNRWISLSHRRLQVHPSQLTKTNVLLDAPLPDWLTTTIPFAKRFQELGIFGDSPHGRANHCLINEYKPGEGIMPHEDGAAYHPVVATVSLGGMIALDILEKRQEGQDEDVGGSKLITRILQEPGSLLVTTSEAYTSLLHGISPIEEDVDLSPDTVANWALLNEATRKKIVEGGGRNLRGVRTSLTFRDVLKVKKIGIGIVGRH